MTTKDDGQKKELLQAKTIVFRLFKFRPRSKKEIIKRLKEKNIAPKVIEKIVEYFKTIGMIDDALFAKGWSRSRLNKPFGIQRICYELRQKGVDQDVIADALDEVTQDYDEVETIVALAEKRLKKYSHLDKQKARQRLYGFLARRGFSSEAIYKACTGLRATHNERWT